MAPNRDTFVRANPSPNTNPSPKTNTVQKPPRLSMENLQRTISDISFELTKEVPSDNTLPAISEAEDASCECCGMSEELTPNYIKKVREKFSGKLICGLCTEAVKGEMEKNGGKRDEALNEHMSACSKFNRLGRAYPVLGQAAAMREILKKNRAKSVSPKDNKGSGQQKGALARSSSCIPAIVKDINPHNMVR